MENTQNRTTSLERNEKKFTNSQPVEIARTFKAPVERVWSSWTQPELAKQWWGPEQFTCPAAKIDFRVGGKYLLAMKEVSSGKVTWSTGKYEEIIPNEKIVCTDSFSDEKGNVISAREAGLPGEWGEFCSLTVEFESINDGDTIMNITHEGIPSEMHDDCVGGWNSSLDKMQRLVERN